MPKRVRNPNPGTRGLGSVPKGWCAEQADHWVRCKIKGLEWTPIEMPRYPTIIRKPALLARIGLSHVAIWRLERDGKFPRRFPLMDPADATAE